MSSLSEFNLENICRTCLSECDSLSIYSICSINEMSFYDILTQHYFINAFENDFPIKICSECSGEIERIAKFKQNCEQSENYLKLYLDEKQKCPIEVKYEVIPSENNEEEENEVFVFLDDVKPMQNEDSSGCDSRDDNELESGGKTWKGSYYKCKLCEQLVQRGKYKEHAKTHTDLRPYPCTICGKSFKQKFHLSRHMLIHTGEEPYKCDICEKTFTRSTFLNEHKSVHNVETSVNYVCEECGLNFINYSQYYKHLKKHESRRTECDYCGETFENLYMLDIHIETHKDVEPLCKVCGKLFDDLRKFRMHMKRHTDNLNINANIQGFKFECPICFRRVQTKSSLRSHLLLHEEKKALCSHCGKKFHTDAQLSAHLRIHTGDRPFKCERCPKSFTFISSLHKHRITHTGDKRYICKICNRAFTQDTHRKRHMLTHTGEKRFECAVCAKKFALKQTYLVHLRIHTGETPYSCQVCGKSYRDHSAFIKHKKSHTM